MKTLRRITATAEQLPITSQNRLGIEVICGAAGSGKTSTALLRLKSLFYMFATRRQREDSTEPVHALVLTFNRTLAGYIRNLAEHQVIGIINVNLEIETFARWAMFRLDYPIIEDSKAKLRLRALAASVDELTVDYVVNEVEYLLGRFKPEDLQDYLSTERTGRGVRPRVGRRLRQHIMALFREMIRRKADWSVQRCKRPTQLPTCEQTEALYPKCERTEYLKRVYVAEEEHFDAVGGWLKEFDFVNVKVLFSRDKFGGCPN